MMSIVHGFSVWIKMYVFDLGDPKINTDPFPAFARLRSEDPVHWSPEWHDSLILRGMKAIPVTLR